MLLGFSSEFLQVTALNTAVQHSIEIANTTTLFQRIRMILLKPINRRALSTLYSLGLRLDHVVDIIAYSRLLRPSSSATAFGF